MEYRGIKLAESVKLYKKDGSFYKKITKTLDKLADVLAEKGFIMVSVFKDTPSKIDLICNKGHEINVRAGNFLLGKSHCARCFGNCPEQAKEEFKNLIESNGHILESEYKGTKNKVLVNFNCGHEPLWKYPDNYRKGQWCMDCSGTSSPKHAKKKFFQLVEKRGHTILSEFVDMTEKVLIDFKCKHKPRLTTPHNYSKIKGCPKCTDEIKAKNQLKKSEKDFLATVKAKGHELLSEYKGKKYKVLINFNCGHEPQQVHAGVYKRSKKSKCPICNRDEANKKQIEKSKQKLIEIVKTRGHEWINVDEFTGLLDYITIDYKCGHDPHSLAGNSYIWGETYCPYCIGHSSEIPKERLLKIAEERGHKISGTYINNHNPIEIEFDCGHINKVSLVAYELSYKNGEKGCKKCSNNCPEQAEEKFLKLAKKEKYKVLGTYKSAKNPIKMKCDKGHFCKISPDCFGSGNRCARCKKSKGVRIIAKWLEENKIKYQLEYRLINKKWLYDIFIPNYSLLIEVHGIQHYEDSYFHNKKKGRSLEKEQENDHKKREYAKKLGYRYIEVDYREHKPKLALERFLEQFEKRTSPEKFELQLSLF